MNNIGLESLSNEDIISYLEPRLISIGINGKIIKLMNVERISAIFTVEIERNVFIAFRERIIEQFEKNIIQPINVHLKSNKMLKMTMYV